MSDCDSSGHCGCIDSADSDDFSGETSYKSSTLGETISNASSEHDEMERAIAQLSKRVAQAKIAVITVLMVLAGSSGFVTYFFTHKALQTSFDIQVSCRHFG